MHTQSDSEAYWLLEMIYRRYGSHEAEAMRKDLGGLRQSMTRRELKAIRRLCFDLKVTLGDLQEVQRPRAYGEMALHDCDKRAIAFFLREVQGR